DDAATALLDVEYRTLARRVLARVAQRSPTSLWRHDRPRMWAAAILLVLADDNGWCGAARTTSKRAILDHLRVRSVDEKVGILRRAAGMERYRHDVALLHSEH